MPINTWNFFRAVSVGSDHASWLSQNPQVEEGRIGGNKEFEQDVTDQYQYEVIPPESVGGRQSCYPGGPHDEEAQAKLLPS